MSAEIKYKGPKSVCICGHTGDGEGSEHSNELKRFYIVRTTRQPVENGETIMTDEGHGACTVCGCKRFTWRKWTDEFREAMLNGK